MRWAKHSHNTRICKRLQYIYTFSTHFSIAVCRSTFKDVISARPAAVQNCAHYSCEHKQHWQKPIFRGIVHSEYLHPSIHSLNLCICSIASRTDKIIISLAYSENIVFLKIIKFIIYMWKRNLSTMRYDQANCCVLSTTRLFGILHSRRYIYFVKCHISLSSNIPFSNLAHTYIKWGT